MFQVFCQQKVILNNSCNYYGGIQNSNIYVFTSDLKAQNILGSILNVSGLTSNFKLVAGNVDNASATIIYNTLTKNYDRYIVYNQTFMYDLEKKLIIGHQSVFLLMKLVTI